MLRKKETINSDDRQQNEISKQAFTVQHKRCLEKLCHD